MDNLSAECCHSAEILNKELLALQRIPGQGRLRTAANLLKRKLKAGEIQSLKKRLEENQRTLDTKVLIDVRQMIVALTTQQDDRYTSVDRELTALVTKLDSCHISAGDHLKTMISSVIESNKHEHQATRLHIGSTVQALTTSQAQKQEETMRYERFLESLRFDDIHVRGNEVSESHSKTFGWVYDDNSKYPWDNLKSWLEHGQNIYWINGKAGSGKSTFMKFLINDERTSKALEIWSGGQNCMILNFYFWLSGTKFQRSMKGFLCSLLRQLVSTNEIVLGGILQTHKTMTKKRSLGDWSTGELRKMLEFAIESVNRTSTICIFVDGIDEFDQDEDVQQLLDLIKELSESPRTKFCLASRPEVHLERCLSQYSKLRLQDLTAKDMKICIRDRLDHIYKLYPSMSIKAEDIDRFFWLMTYKADGVFLWVYFALNSLLQGIRKEDDFEALLTRLEDLPSGMERLYQQMWLRHNGDEQRYREEANLYFSYHEYFPVSLFEMVVALNDDIQTKYFQEMRAQDPTQLAQKCEILRKRILTRCAGLLEVTESARNSEHDKPSSSTSRSDNFQSSTKHSEELEETFTNDRSQLVEREEGCGSNQSPALHSTSSNESLSTELSAHASLHMYHNLEIKFLHRTARDFLLDTKAGHELVGGISQKRDDLFWNLTRARMATLLEGLESFRATYFGAIMEDIGLSNTQDEIELLEILRHVCKALHVPGSPIHDITRSAFWIHGTFDETSRDFIGLAAEYSCTKYVQWYVDHATTYLSPYYLGFLLLGAFGAKFNEDFKIFWKKQLELAIWLAEKGADLNTKQVRYHFVTSPSTYILYTILDWDTGDSFTEIAAQLPQLIEKLYPKAGKSEEKFILSNHIPFLPFELRVLLRRYNPVIEIESSCLWRIVLNHLQCNGIFIEDIISVPTRLSTPLKVVNFNYKGREYSCSDVKDAVYLGQAYQKVLFPEDYTDAPAQSLEIFTSRLKEVIPRCEKVSRPQWEYEMDLTIDPPENALTLDPSEDVDESNWKERGYFRTVARTPHHGSIFTVMDQTVSKREKTTDSPKSNPFSAFCSRS